MQQYQPFSHRDSALPQQQRLANSPPLYVHTKLSSSGVKPHQCVNSYSKPAQRIQKRRDGTDRDIDIGVVPPPGVQLLVLTYTR